MFQRRPILTLDMPLRKGRFLWREPRPQLLLKACN